LSKIGIKTLLKFLNLCVLTLDRVRPLTVDEIAERIQCSKGHAYNYQRALNYLYPKEMLEHMRQNREERTIQQRLD